MKNQLEPFIDLIPCPWMPTFIFKNKKGNICNGHRTFFMQEMINENILFQGIVVPSLSFTRIELNHFVKGCESCMETYKAVLYDGYENHLKGIPTKAVLESLTNDINLL